MSDEHLHLHRRDRKAENGGYELVFPGMGDTHLFHRPGNLISGAFRLKVPTLFIRGAETDTFWEEAARLVKRKQPRAKVETLDSSTHLLPLERPKAVFDIIQSFLKEMNVPQVGTIET
jgi:pimeloyl-ACP methyl ester carboxylesterase